MYGLDRLQHINQHLPSKTDFLRILEEKISSVAKKKVLAMTIKLMNGRDNRKPPGGPGLQISTITQKFNLALWEHRKVRPAQRLRDVTKCENLRILGKMKMLFCAVQQVTANLKETLLVRTAQCSWLVHKYQCFQVFSFFVRSVAALIRFSILHKLYFTIQSWFLKNWASGPIISSRSWSKEVKTYLPAQPMHFLHYIQQVRTLLFSWMLVKICTQVEI